MIEPKRDFASKASRNTEIWDVNDVARNLKISRPTAYRLMHMSGAELATPRRCRVFVPLFIEYLRKGGADEE